MIRRMKCLFPAILTRYDQTVVHVLIIVFGISAWIGVNGIFVQLPLLVNVSPQKSELPAYLVILIQAANVVPAAYMLSRHFTKNLNEVPCVIALLSLGTLAMALLVFFYNETTTINGTSYSLALFVLTFLTAQVGCSSSVVFMPYLRSFKEVYLVSYFIGEGLSGVLPSVLALIQGVGGNQECVVNANNETELAKPHPPRFTSDYYFLCLFVVLLLSLMSFLVLQYSSIARKERNVLKMEDVKSADGDVDENRNVANPSRIVTSYLLIVMAVVCFFGNGFLPSIQSYTCLPFGNTVYHLSVALSLFANPAVCSLALWCLPRSLTAIHCMLLGAIVTGSYITYLGLASPFPPLQHSPLGMTLVVVSWIVVMALISYVKLIIASIFRFRQQARSLFHAGIVMQIGSACGAIASFTLIKFTTLFKMYDPCSENAN